LKHFDALRCERGSDKKGKQGKEGANFLINHLNKTTCCIFIWAFHGVDESVSSGKRNGDFFFGKNAKHPL
jgi:hypothetical protein